MSVILRNHPSTLSSSTGIEDGFPPGDVEILRYNEIDQKVQILWSDPDNTIINGSTISTWAGTVLVRNDNHYPINVEDGVLVINNTTKNAYKESYFEDTGLTNDITYYYRFFPYSTEGVYNNSGNLVFKATPVAIPKLFANASWDQVIKACQNDSVPDTWNIGDEKDIELTGQYAQTITMQKKNKKLDSYSDGSGKAPLTFGMKALLKDRGTLNDSAKRGWPSTDIRSDMADYINCFPENIKNAIKEVSNWYTTPGWGAHAQVSWSQTDDKLYIPSVNNINYTNSITSCPNDHTYPIFTDENSRLKRINGSLDYWWTRSVYHSNGYFMCVTSSGYVDGRMNMLEGICLVFCL